MVIFQGGKVHLFWMNGDASGLNLGIFIAKTHIMEGENGKKRGEVYPVCKDKGRRAGCNEMKIILMNRIRGKYRFRHRLFVRQIIEWFAKNCRIKFRR